MEGQDKQIESNLQFKEERETQDYSKLKRKFKALREEYLKVLTNWEDTHKKVKTLTKEKKFLRDKLDCFLKSQHYNISDEALTAAIMAKNNESTPSGLIGGSNPNQVASQQVAKQAAQGNMLHHNQTVSGQANVGGTGVHHHNPNHHQHQQNHSHPQHHAPLNHQQSATSIGSGTNIGGSQHHSGVPHHQQQQVQQKRKKKDQIHHQYYPGGQLAQGQPIFNTQDVSKNSHHQQQHQAQQSSNHHSGGNGHLNMNQAAPQNIFIATNGNQAASGQPSHQQLQQMNNQYIEVPQPKGGPIFNTNIVPNGSRGENSGMNPQKIQAQHQQQHHVQQQSANQSHMIAQQQHSHHQQQQHVIIPQQQMHQGQGQLGNPAEYQLKHPQQLQQAAQQQQQLLPTQQQHS